MRCTAAASGDMTSDQVRGLLPQDGGCGSIGPPRTPNYPPSDQIPGSLVKVYVCPCSDYKLLGILKRQFPKVPLLGLTATATSSVLKDCEKILCVKQPVTLTASFNRTNLYYEVRTMATSHSLRHHFQPPASCTDTPNVS